MLSCIEGFHFLSRNTKIGSSYICNAFFIAAILFIGRNITQEMVNHANRGFSMALKDMLYFMPQNKPEVVDSII